MAEQQITIPVSDKRAVTVIRTPPEGRRSGWTFVYAPGAGSNVHDPFGTYACRALASRGFQAVRLQFPYMEEKRRGPDRPPVLEATWRAVIDEVRLPRGRLLVGGRSMGGRIGSHVVSQGVSVDALVLYAYPLHPPGKPEQRRDAHLPAITVPALFCSGTRDAFASPEDLRDVASSMANAAVHTLEAADHGFAAPKSSGRTRQEIWDEAVSALADWLSAL